MKQKYGVKGIVFYDGSRCKYEENRLTLAPEEWDTKGSIRGLPYHVDDSDVTINLCIGGEFKESGIEFESGVKYNHVVGGGIVHDGNISHKVIPCVGERYNMLFFLKSVKSN